jgi:hypothetical protein
MGKRTTNAVFRAPTTVIDDERYIAERTALLAGRIEPLTSPS